MGIKYRLQAIEKKHCTVTLDQVKRRLERMPTSEHADYYTTLPTAVLEELACEMAGIPKAELTYDKLRELASYRKGP